MDQWRPWACGAERPTGPRASSPGSRFWSGVPVVGCRRVRIARIPRPDQTVFCPDCEAQILN